MSVSLSFGRDASIVGQLEQTAVIVQHRFRLCVQHSHLALARETRIDHGLPLSLDVYAPQYNPTRAECPVANIVQKLWLCYNKGN